MLSSFSRGVTTAPRSIGNLLFHSASAMLRRNLNTLSSVVQPPPDQQGYTRLGVFYFCMTDDDVRLDPLVPSQDSNEVGDGEKKVNPTMREWRRARTAAYGQSALRTAEGGVEEEEINGIVVKHYN